MSTATRTTRTFTARWLSSRGRSGRERTLRQMIADYRDAGAGSGRKIALVLLLAVNGLLEGLALAALIPALNAGFASSTDPGLFGRLLGAGAGANRDTVILRSIVLFAVLGVGSALATFLVGRLTIRIRYQIEADLRRKMTRALLDMPWLPFLEMRLGDITKTVLLDGSQAAIGVVSLLQAVGATVVTGVFLVVALAISVPMTLFTLAFGAVAVLAYKRASARASAHSAELSSVTDELSRETTEVFGGFKYVRATGLSEEAWSRTAALVEKFRDKSVRSMIPSTVVRFLYEGSGILFVGGFLAISLVAASAEIGTSLVFLAVFYRLAPRLTLVNDSLYLARILQPWYESWREVYRVASAVKDEPGGARRLPRFACMSARDVDFAYPTTGPILSGIDLELRKGTCTAIVGESGSGKTTLMDLLVGLLDPLNGEVTVDGVVFAEVDRAWWRSQLGLVMQESTMFSGTVGENVAIGDRQPDRDRILRCLRMAAAADFVLATPDGLDSHIGERGSKLSGGQRQRLALARALYRDPGLLCLDEATAALDADSEALIMQAVSEIKRDRAVLLVTHRAHTLSVADQIVVLEGGRIAELGSWEELTSAPTRFRRILESQSA